MSKNVTWNHTYIQNPKRNCQYRDAARGTWRCLRGNGSSGYAEHRAIINKLLYIFNYSLPVETNEAMKNNNESQQPPRILEYFEVSFNKI